ncbi:wax ester/triacylglycerol synthase domain-containing protein [Williamsia serinedens]|uniref:diacylglycerol O-acyltransferase n=1 Tax=Williamsia serinedens TaxID=391736 RepID=A0ABT1GXC6_9NOCA|nr:wax ester/triacylglycerol synthase domain-containing protein [Williamsia serinedens]MCP2159399.1 acyltransferase, WS/DGAT/MGAT [Williamsia serinedens]
MRQLSSRDAAYLFLGDRHSSATVISAWVLDHPVDALPLTDENVRSRLRAMADLDEHLRCRVHFVPLSLGLPYWQLDPDFTVARHYRRHPAGLTWHEATRALADIGDRRLPLDMPLWFAHLLPDVSGVPGQTGASTILAIMWHHAAFDGTRWTQLTRYTLADPTDERGPAPDVWSAGTSHAGRMELFGRELVRSPVTWWRFLTAAIGRGRANRRDPAARSELEKPGPWPHTRFSGPMRGARTCSFVELSLTRAQQIKRGCPGATINDVMLSVIGSALRQYLADLEEPYGPTLAALVPIATQGGATGVVNQFAASIVDLHTDIADPRVRVAAISASAADAKEKVNARHAEAAETGLPAPLLRALGALSRSSRLNGHAATGNVAITNIGPTRGVTSMAGLPIATMFGMQTIGTGCLLAHSIRSVHDRLSVSITTDASVMPDVDAYLGYIARSFDDHHAATHLA